MQVTSINQMRETAGESINAMRLRELFDRVGICKDRYWEIPKEERIRVGLRFGLGEDDYSGAKVVKFCTDLLTRAFRGVYPFQGETIEAIIRFGRDKYFQSPAEVIAVVEEQVAELEQRLDSYDRGD